MQWLDEIWRRLSFFFRRGQFQRELKEEMDDHVRMKQKDLTGEGMPPDDARNAARREFGNALLLRERSRDPWGFRWLETLLQDLRYGLRQLLRSPGFTAIAIITLALGIGANAAIFSFVDAALLKPLPYPHPDRIVGVWAKVPGVDRWVTSTLNYLDWKRENHCFQFLSAVSGRRAILTGSGRPQEIYVQTVSASYFKALGVGAALGRTFAPGEDRLGKDQEVVLSNRVWQSQFGGDPKIIGRKITLDAKSYTIIGVLPANSAFDRTRAAMWLPLAFRPADMTRNFHWLTAIARLRPGVTVKQARAQMDAIGARLAAAYPNSNKGWGVTVDHYEIAGQQLRRSLWVLFAAVGAVLLIGCANLANMTLARGIGREHEIAIRSALGARRLRLIRQLLTESILLAFLGCAAGLALGDALMRGIKLWLPPDMLPPEANVHMDYSILFFTLVIGVLTGVVFGLAPALTGTRPDLAGSLKEGGRTTSGLTQHRMRKALVIAEVALSFVLLAGAGLLIRSFNRLSSINPGVDTTNVLAMDLPMPLSQLTNSTKLTNYFREITDNVRSLPGVLDAAMTNAPPMEGWVRLMPGLIEGRGYLPNSQRPGFGFKKIGPSYFDTVGMRLLKGRGLTESDTAGAAPVAVINETTAKTYFKGEDPIGKRILVQQIVPGAAARGPEIPWQVVGVVSDEKVDVGKLFGLGDNLPVMYVTFYQSPVDKISLVVRAAMNPSLLTQSIKRAIWKVNKDQVVADVATLEEIKYAAVAPARLRTVLLAIFAGVAVLLAAVGIYGVLSYSVAQKVHELAIRLALGASAGDLLKLVVGKAMLMVLVGLALGAVAALALTRVLASLLYDTSPTDPVTLIATAILLAMVALLACYIPARRVTKVDPMVALRYE
ncbi:MAG TPA: ABC transporter permease [Terriglobia bacterium]|nr:ABC transporter permease [Terriglobia bacterium]